MWLVVFLWAGEIQNVTRIHLFFFLQERNEFLARGNRLQELFDKDFKNAFNICQSTDDS